MDRKVVVVVSELDHQDNHVDGEGCYCDLQYEQKTFSLEELLVLPWFKQYLQENGFFCKDALDESGLTHLNRFVYEIKNTYWSDYTTNIERVYPYNTITAVYQEVIGPERIKALSKWKKEHEKYVAKKREIENKKLAQKKQKEAKLKQLKLAKARKLLEQEGLIDEANK